MSLPVITYANLAKVFALMCCLALSFRVETDLCTLKRWVLVTLYYRFTFIQ